MKLDSDEVLALSRRDPHIRHCSIPWRPQFQFQGTTGWFRDPCGGSTYDMIRQSAYPALRHARWIGSPCLSRMMRSGSTPPTASAATARSHAADGCRPSPTSRLARPLPVDRRLARTRPSSRLTSSLAHAPSSPRTSRPTTRSRSPASAAVPIAGVPSGSPSSTAIDGDGDLLDVGCANGYLLECLVAWGAERGLALTPHGVDIGPLLIAEAKRRLPEYAAQLPRRPTRGTGAHPAVSGTFIPCTTASQSRCCATTFSASSMRSWSRVVASSSGRTEAYPARSPSLLIADVLAEYGHTVAGRSFGGAMADGKPVSSFAWVDNSR